MKATVFNTMCRLSLFIFILAVACKKDSNSPDESNEQLYTVAFDFQDFDASSRPLNSRASVYRKNTFRASSDPTAQTQVGFLYLWSFNAQNWSPDIALHGGSVISHVPNTATPSFTAAGWVFDEYSAGNSVSITGLSELVIAMPIERATAFEEFGFHVASTNTGPKTFSLEYSFDNVNWTVESGDNQFSSTSANARNAFVFDFADLAVEDEDMFYVKIIPAAGERGSAGDYNPTAGVTRFDNIYLTGMATAAATYSIDELHYYVFDAVSNELVASDVQPFDAGSGSLELALPYGQYNFAFVRNHSAAALMLPTLLSNSSAFYFSNTFSNHLANIFASEVTIQLDEDKDESITLSRYYSQIKFEFTDSHDLSLVDRLVISQKHEPFFYAPYHSDMVNPVLDQSDIVLMPDFAQSKEVVFNQFLGRLATARPISYQVDVYGDDDELLRSFEVSASLRNNIQLVFRGELLSGVHQQANFEIQINEDWDDEVEIGF